MALLALAVLAAPAVASAQIYRWADERGQVHYSQGLHSVPDRHRATATPLHFPPPPPESLRAVAPIDPASGELARIPFRPGEPIWVDALVNGSGPLTLMLDTGAAASVINPRALAALGVSSRSAERGTIRGATGTANVLYVPVESIAVGSATAGPLRVISHDVELGFGDGLLGRDFLDRFRLTIDNETGIATLAPRR